MACNFTSTKLADGDKKSAVIADISQYYNRKITTNFKIYAMIYVLDNKKYAGKIIRRNLKIKNVSCRNTEPQTRS